MTAIRNAPETQAGHRGTVVRRRSLFVVACLALLVTTIAGAKPLTADHSVNRGHALTTAHAASGITAMRHKSNGSPRSTLRLVATAGGAEALLSVLTGVAIAALALVAIRRHHRATLSLRGPPSFQI